MNGAYLQKTWIPFTRDALFKVWLKLAQWFRKKYIFVLRQCIFAISLLSLLENGQSSWFIWTNLNPIHPRMLCLKCGRNWPSGSGEDNENVKNYRQWQTTDKFRSGDTQLSLRLRWAKKHMHLFPCLYLQTRGPWDTSLTWETNFWSITNLRRAMIIS